MSQGGGLIYTRRDLHKPYPNSILLYALEANSFLVASYMLESKEKQDYRRYGSVSICSPDHLVGLT